MNPTIEQEVIEAVRVLPEEKQRKVLEYVKQIRETEDVEKPKKRKFLQEIEEIMSQLPKEALEGYPTDGSLNHDHYLYGAPKRDQK